MQQKVFVTDHGPEVIGLGQFHQRLRRIGLIAAGVEAAEIRQGREGAQVDGARNEVEVRIAEIDAFLQQFQEAGADPGLNFEPHRIALSAFVQLLLDLREQALRISIGIQFTVTSDPEDDGIQNPLAGEQVNDVLPNDLFEQDVVMPPLGGRTQETRDDRWNLNDGQPRLLGALLRLEQDPQVRTQVLEDGKGFRAIDTPRGQNREDLLVEHLRQAVPLRLTEFFPREEPDAGFGHLRQDIIHRAAIGPSGQVLGLDRDRLKLVRDGHPRGALRGRVLRILALQAGDPNHEELVQVVPDDAQETEAFEQRDFGVQGLFQHLTVESQPRQLAIEESLIHGSPK